MLAGCAVSWSHAQSPPVLSTEWAGVLQNAQLGVVALSVQWPKAGSKPATSSAGTGFAIAGAPGEYYIVTAAHVLPDSIAYEELVIEAEMRPPFVTKRGPVRLHVQAIDRGQLADLAVLVPQNFAGLAFTTLASQGIDLKQGLPVGILGHPEGRASEFVDAFVAGEGPDQTVKLTGIVEAGYSGAPVLDHKGRVICVVRGGEPVADVPAEKKVMGKALCTPIQ